MGLFVMNMEETPTVEGLVKDALANLDLYSDYCCVLTEEGWQGRFKDELGQTPPDYLVTSLAMKYLKQALEILESHH